MNKVITDREDLFWAKMAGRNVDISTMTPPVAASTREELMLEVADRIGNSGEGGGSLPEPGAVGNVMTSTGDGWESAPPQGGGEYETVAEIDVGQMIEEEGIYTFSPENARLTSSSSTYYWDGHPLTKSGDTYYYNYSESGPVFPDEPLFLLVTENDMVTLIGCSEPLSNTTVKILKKVSNQYVVTITESHEQREDPETHETVTVTVYTATHDGEAVTVAEIYEAYAADKLCVCDLVLEKSGIPIRLQLGLAAQAGGGAGILFSGAMNFDITEDSPIPAATLTVLGMSGEPDIWSVSQSYDMPPVTALDNGKIPQVVGGHWTAVDNPYAPYIVHLNLTFTDASSGTGTTTDGKKVDEILAEAATNPLVYCEFSLGTGTVRAPLVNYAPSSVHGKTVFFSGVSSGGARMTIEGRNNSVSTGASDEFIFEIFA